MKRKLSILLSAVMLLSLTACGPGDASSSTSSDSNAASSSSSASASDPADSSEGEVEMQVVWYYHGDENAESIVEEQTELPKGFGPQEVIDLLAEKEVLPEGIVVNEWDIDKDNVMKIDFNAAFNDAVQQMGTAGERMIMGSTVNSLISDFDLDGVSVTIDGETLSTGHDIYDYVLEFYE